MPQIERPTVRQPLRDLPLSLFVHPDFARTESLLGKKRPYSPSSIVSPSKRRLLAVEGVLSPRSPFKKAAADLSRALPSASPAARNLLDEFQRPPVPRRIVPLPQFPFARSPQAHPTGSGVGLRPAQELSPGGAQPKPRVAPEPTRAEVQLLETLKKAPKPSYVFLPGSGVGRPIRKKEEDPEEDHYPGFDIYEDGQSEQGDASEIKTNGTHGLEEEPEDEEEAVKENQPIYDPSAYRFATPTLSARSSMSSLGAPPPRSARTRLQREVDRDAFDSDDDLL